MRKSYVTFEAKVLLMETEDVLTASAEFKDATTGDNGVWFPGNENGKEESWQ